MPNKTIIQVPVVLTDILVWRPTQDEVGNWQLTVSYRVRTAGGVQIGGQREANVALTPSQITTITNFATANILPAINAQEGT